MEVAAVQYVHPHSGKSLWDFGPLFGIWEVFVPSVIQRKSDPNPFWTRSIISRQGMKLNYSKSTSPLAIHECQEDPFQPLKFVRWCKEDDKLTIGQGSIKWPGLYDTSLIEAIREHSHRGGAEFFREQYCGTFDRVGIDLSAPVTGNNPNKATVDDIGDISHFIIEAKNAMIDAKRKQDMATMRCLIEHMFTDMRDRLINASRHNKNMCMEDIVDAVKYECIKSAEALVNRT